MKAKDYFSELSKLSKKLDYKAIEQAAQMIKNCEGTIYAIGNGGSATTASHFAVDFLKSIGKKVFSLGDNSGVITAIGNDVDFRKVYEGQLSILLKRGDLVVCISVSGESPNLIEAVSTAKVMGSNVIGLLGRRGEGVVSSYCDIVIAVDSDSYELCEDLHLAICHCMKELLR